MEEKDSKQLSWLMIALIAFNIVWGLGNVVNNFAQQGIVVITSWILLLIIYFIPYTLMVIGGVSALLFLEESNKLNVLVVTLVFTLIALGNDIFGLLKINALKVLGEISYSIYLLHGIVLYVMIDLVLGRDFVKGLTVLEYWLMIFGLTPILVIICTLTFKYIEKPFINKGKK